MSDQTSAIGVTKYKYKFSILRIILCCLLLTALTAACLYVYYTAFDFYRDRLLAEESKTLAWFTKEIGLSLPFIVICLFHYMVYHKADRRDGVARREMFWEILGVTVLVYAVLLPYLEEISDALHTNALAAGETIPQTDAKIDITLLMELHEWIIRFTIPLGVLMVFHGMRARREIRHPETEEEEAPITVAEYEARKAAAQSAAQSAAQAAGQSFEPLAEKPAPVSDTVREVAHE